MSEIIQEGIYFGLPPETYHDVHRIGSGGIKKLYASPCDWWWNTPMNPVRPDLENDDTPARQFGRALHHCILYGREAFDRQYQFIKAKTVTSKELATWLIEQGSVPATLKEDRLKQVREEYGITLLDQQTYNEIVVAASMIIKNPHLASAFADGWPEVAIFWTDDGVPCKALIDYLKYGSNVDLKSFRSKDRLLPYDQQFIRDVRTYGYHVQMNHYLAGRMKAREFAAEGRIFGDVRPTQAELVKHLSKPEPGFTFVAYKADGAPVAKSFDFPFRSPIIAEGGFVRAKAMENYRNYFARFGTDTWVLMDEPYPVTGDWHEELGGY